MTRFVNTQLICGGTGLPMGGCIADGLAAGIHMSDFTAASMADLSEQEGSLIGQMTPDDLGSQSDLDTALKALDSNKFTILPGFCDVHVHFREPGFSYKETIRSGSLAAARGGYTAVCPMPNLKPVPDSLAHMQEELDLIRDGAVIDIRPYASITVNEEGRKLSDMEDLAAVAVAFSDDGKGVQDEGMMRAAMYKAKSLGKMIVAHCEVNELLKGGYIHDGSYAASHGHAGICSESEWRPIERDVRLSEETGCAYHVCHISTKESVQIIREAKANGVNVTCETGPHYLVLDERDLQEDGRFKMNPPQFRRQRSIAPGPDRRDHRLYRYRPCTSQRRGKVPRIKGERNGYRRPGDGISHLVYRACTDRDPDNGKASGSALYYSAKAVWDPCRKL